MKTRALQWLALALILGTLFLGFLGTAVEFRRSGAWRGTSEWVVLLLAAWPGWYLARISNVEMYTDSALRTIAGSFMVRWIAAPVIVYCFFWMAYTVAVPDLITRFFGKPFSETYVLRGEYNPRYRRCKRRVHGPPFENRILHAYYCARESEFAQLPGRWPDESTRPRNLVRTAFREDSAHRSAVEQLNSR